MEQEEILEPVQEPEEVQIDISALVEQQSITNQKLETLTLQLADQNRELQAQLHSIYLFVMLLALLEVRKVFKGIISKVRSK